jgi:hypothetical protein
MLFVRSVGARLKRQGYTAVGRPSGSEKRNRLSCLGRISTRRVRKSGQFIYGYKHCVNFDRGYKLERVRTGTQAVLRNSLKPKGGLDPYSQIGYRPNRFTGCNRFG